MQIQEGLLRFSQFKQFSSLECVMSTRRQGNMNLKPLLTSNADALLAKLKISSNQLVAMKQVHGNEIVRVNKKSGGTIMNDCDGLVTEEPDAYLGVKAADCVPIFFYDDVKKIVGIAHAGWRGTLKNIAGKMVQKLKDFGCNPKNIFVAIGPHIGGCCYNVPKARALEFASVFHDERIVYQMVDQWFLDIGQANRRQLLEAGIKNDHLEALPSCTSCQNDTYFSFRKDSPQQHGEMLGIIGMRRLIT